MKRLFLVLILLLASCAGNTKAADIGGSDGLSITLGEIPKVVYEGQGITVPVTLENLGASKAENGILLLTSFDPDVIHLDSQKIITGINLEGRSELTSIGEKSVNIFNIGSITLPEGKETTETLNVVACYQYTTEASPVVCINPNFNTGQPILGGCNPKKVDLNPTQGAPVAVTNVEVIQNPEKVDFRIYLDYVSSTKGTIVPKDSYSKSCIGNEEVKSTETNMINLEAYLSGEKLTCTSIATGKTADNGFRIRGSKEPSVLCSARVDSTQQSYTTPLSIKLSYGHVISQSFSVDLRSPLARS